MKKGKFARNAGIAVASVFICLIVFWVLSVNNVMGKFVPEEPYVTGAPEGASVVVTSEGGSQKGTLGSGAEPCSDEVPTAEGMKGSETNPFVILEIVPQKEMQQFTYLSGNVDYGMPENLDAMKIGIEMTQGKQSFLKEQSLTNLGFRAKFKEWFCENKYSVYKIGSKTEKESLPFVELAKLYSFQITDDDIKNAGYSEEEFAKHFAERENNKLSVKTFIGKHYPKLFEKNESGNVIRDIALEDDHNWDIRKVDGNDVQHDVVFTSDDLINADDYKYYLDVSKILRENPNVFSHDSSGNKISVSIRNDVDHWTGECTKTDSYDYTVVTKNIAEEDYKEYVNGKMEIKDLIGKYSNLFQKDKDGKTIEKSRLGVNDWELKKTEEEHPVTLNSGYLHYVGNGGEYSYEIDWSANLHVLREKKDGQWEFLEKLPDGAKEGEASKYWGDIQNSEYYWSVSELEKAPVGNGKKVAKISKTKLYTFTYKKDISHYKFSYSGKQKAYSFEYWGLRNNEILKRTLFTFKDQEEYDNFHMKVICMTPAELNELAKKDKPETLDMIERADMFSFQTCGPNVDEVNDTKFFYEFYHEYILGEDKYEFDKDNVVRFYENDLEWDLCTKIIMRESENRNLPLVFNQMVGKILEFGVTQDESIKETHMYVTEGIENDPQSYLTDVSEKGSLNNISKLYLISIQFDLLARKGKDGLKRTFMEDIFPHIQKIPITKAEGAVENTATMTGYYSNRPLCGCSEENWPQVKKERSYYLWNRYTFFPSDWNINLKTMDRSDEKVINSFVEQGYLPTYFNTNANPFIDGGLQSHQSGSDGSDEKNVTVISDESNSNSNHSSLLMNKGDNGEMVNHIFDVVYQILNGQSDEIENLTVSVVKQKKRYVKLSDDMVLIDYNSDTKYESDKTLYLKVKVSNVNNEAGIITNVRLLSDEGEPITLGIQDAIDANTLIQKENVYDSKGNNPIYGYRVPANGSITFFIPYSLYDWQSGYQTVELVTKARMYNEVRDRFVTGKAIPHEIAISERTLFNLE